MSPLRLPFRHSGSGEDSSASGGRTGRNFLKIDSLRPIGYHRPTPRVSAEGGAIGGNGGEAGGPLEFKVGDKVVYPNHGVGVIERVAKKSIGDMVSSFYCLRILSTDSTVMVPVGNTSTVGLRKVLSRRQTTQVLKVLKDGEVATFDDWKGRFQANSEKMRTGDILAVAEVLKSLTMLSEVKPLSYRERKMLDRARFLLVTELAEAANKTTDKIEAQIDAALSESMKSVKSKIEH